MTQYQHFFLRMHEVCQSCDLPRLPHFYFLVLNDFRKCHHYQPLGHALLAESQPLSLAVQQSLHLCFSCLWFQLMSIKHAVNIKWETNNSKVLSVHHPGSE